MCTISNITFGHRPTNDARHRSTFQIIIIIITAEYTENNALTHGRKYLGVVLRTSVEMYVTLLKT